MNIYFSCSITGGRADQGIYSEIVKFLLVKGHEVPTAHLASADLAQLETVSEPEEIFQRDINWVRQCDVLIAEVSTASHGVGYEIAEAVNRGKPVLCLYQKGKIVSKMITGNTENNVVIVNYDALEKIPGLIDRFLERYT